jgi:hypothetical protein
MVRVGCGNSFMQPADPHAASREQVAAVHLGSMISADGGQPSGSVRCLQSEGAVWTLPVVVLGGEPQDLVQVPSADHQQPIQVLGATVPIHRSAKTCCLQAGCRPAVYKLGADRLA